MSRLVERPGHKQLGQRLGVRMPLSWHNPRLARMGSSRSVNDERKLFGLLGLVGEQKIFQAPESCRDGVAALPPPV